MKKKLLNFVKSLFKVMDKKIVGTSQHYEMTDVNIYNSLKIYPKIIIDIGANVGDTVSEFRKSFSDSKIYAFEPDKNVFQRLSKRFKDDKNIFCYENAISNVEGDQDFYVSNESNLLSSLLEKENTIKTSVKTIKLEDFIASNNIQKIDIIKLDTEGFDLEILKSAKELFDSGIVDIVIVEVSFSAYINSSNFSEINKFMTENKFKTLGLYDPEYSNVLDKGVFKVANAIFVNNTTFNNYLNS
jgi:FkbM family methyltransferase